jgi:hypothetical protein
VGKWSGFDTNNLFTLTHIWLSWAVTTIEPSKVRALPVFSFFSLTIWGSCACRHGSEEPPWPALLFLKLSCAELVRAKCMCCPSGVVDGLRGERKLMALFSFFSSFSLTFTFLPEGVDLGSLKICGALFRVNLDEKFEQNFLGGIKKTKSDQNCLKR